MAKFRSVTSAAEPAALQYGQSHWIYRPIPRSNGNHHERDATLSPEATSEPRKQQTVSAPDTQLISIVDDDESVREGTTSLLRSAGFSAKSFSSAQNFLDAPCFQKTACLILDVRMPGLSGPQLQRRLASENRQIPIIFITAHEDRAIRSEAMKAGAVDFLAKPFSEEALLRAVHSGLEAAARSRDLRADNNQQPIIGNEALG